MTEKPYEIYEITTKDYWYVGSASGNSTARKRFTKHIGGRGNAKKLWAAIQELGSEAFSLRVIESGLGDPIEAETRWYYKYLENDTRQTLNGKCPNGWDGHVPSEEDRERSRQRLLGNTYSLGLKRSVETRAKLSAAKTGSTRRVGPNESAIRSLRNLGNTYGKGKHPSPETLQKLSNWQKGKPKWSDEQRAAMSVARKGRFMHVNQMQYECADCDMVTNPGSMARHTKASGHTKR